MIRRTLEEMKAESVHLEIRVRALEEWKAEHTGVEKKMAVWAGAFGAAFGVLAGVFYRTGLTLMASSLSWASRYWKVSGS